MQTIVIRTETLIFVGAERGTCRAMMLDTFMVGGVLVIWIKVRQGTSVLAVGAGGVGVDIFSLMYYSLSFLLLCGRRPDID